MNAKRFIELVNLYVDSEISGEELEELETEVAQNPDRRTIFNQYRRLQDASHTAYQEYEGSLVQTVDLKKYHVLARESGKRLRLGILYTAASITAASLAVMAAISIVQETSWSEPPSPRAETSVARVEVFQPDPIPMPARLSSFESAAGTAFFGPPTMTMLRGDTTGTFRAAARTGFQLTVNPTLWEDQSRAGSTARVFRDSPSFESAELVSFQFQR